jgi:NTP pyrophosphatase (non-canonical NTP hydrolase)
MRSCNINLTSLSEFDLNFLHSVSGCVTEAGELMDIFKKHFVYGKPLDTNHIIEEYGDLLWYIAQGLESIGSSLFVAMALNIDKLKKRYPDAFSAADALARADKEGETDDDKKGR